MTDDIQQSVDECKQNKAVDCEKGEVDTAESVNLPPPEAWVAPGEILAHGTPAPALLSREIDLTDSARGRLTIEGHWKDWNGPVGELIANLSTHKETAKKDGHCILQGAVIDRRRKVNAVRSMDLMILDLDTGESLDRMREKVRELGLFCLLYTTYSNGTSYSDISENTLIKHAGGSVPTIEHARDYLITKKRYQVAVLEGATLGAKKQTSDGMMFPVHHQPMERFRAVFLLSEPFVFAKRGGTQSEAVTEWKELYAGLAERLGAFHDRSCTDPSRLFYTPSHPANPALPPRIELVAGDALDLATVPRVKSTRGVVSNVFTESVKDLSSNRGAYVTPDLFAFFGKYGKSFEMDDFLLEVDPDGDHGPRPGGQPGRSHVCPNDGMHSDAGNPDDRGFFCVNASDSHTEGAIAKCMHDSCAEVDRIKFVDLVCEREKIGSAYDLRKWVVEAEEEEGRLFASVNDARGAIARVPAGDAAKAKEVARRLALSAFGPIDAKDLQDRLAAASGIGKNAIKGEVKEARKAKRGGKPSGGFQWPCGVTEVDGWLVQIRQDDDARKLCPVFTPLAITRSQSGGKWGLLIGFVDADGRQKEHLIDGDGLHGNEKELWGQLQSSGLPILTSGDGKALLRAVLGELAADRSLPRLLTVDQTGWSEDRAFFITAQGDVIGTPPKGEEVRLEPNALTNRTRSKKGTLENEKLALAAALSDERQVHWNVAALAAFAGAVQQLAGMDSGGLALVGETSTGKSMALKIQAMAWGDPKAGKGTLYEAKGTRMGLELPAKFSTGCAFGLDELAFVDERELGKMIMSLGGEGGNNRMAGSASAQREVHASNTFTLVSTERRIKDMLPRGAAALGGYESRLPEIDCSGVVTYATDDEEGQRVLRTLHLAKDNYGHSGPEFVANLIDEGWNTETGVTRLRRELDAIARGIAAKDARLQRAAQKLALLWWAGEAGERYGLLDVPHPSGVISRVRQFDGLGDVPRPAGVVRIVVAAWATFDGAAMNTEVSVVEALRANVVAQMGRAIVSLTPLRTIKTAEGVPTYESAPGYGSDAKAFHDEDAGVLYILKREFASMCGGATSETNAALKLKEFGCLIPGKKQHREYHEYLPGKGHLAHYRIDMKKLGMEKGGLGGVGDEMRRAGWGGAS